MRHVWQLTIGIVIVASMLSCGEQPDEASGYSVRDSAGVRIVESTEPMWSEGSGWVVSSEPLVHIGEAEGDPHYLFSRVESGRMLPAGAFVMVERGTNTLRRYSAKGVFEWEAAREGDGPGEFRIPAVLQVAKPDTLLVFDGGTGRLSVFSPRGIFLRTTSLRVPGILTPYISGIAFADDGGMVALTSGSSPNTPDKGMELGIRRPLAFVLRFNWNGDFVDTVAVLPGTEAELFNASPGIAVDAPPYGHVTSYAVRDTDFVIGLSDHLEVEIRSSTGALRQILRGPDPELKLTDDDVKAYRDWSIGRWPASQRAGESKVLDAMFYPEVKAAYSFVRADPEGNVWLGARGPNWRISSSWIVFSAEGRLLGDVPFPAGFRVLDFSSSAVLGVWADELGIQQVRVYAIQK